MVSIKSMSLAVARGTSAVVNADLAAPAKKVVSASSSAKNKVHEAKQTRKSIRAAKDLAKKIEGLDQEGMMEAFKIVAASVQVEETEEEEVVDKPRRTNRNQKKVAS